MMFISVVTYQVYALTGDLACSSTTADVKINIFGEYGDSGERSLIKSKTSNMPFQRGQVSSFLLRRIKVHINQFFLIDWGLFFGAWLYLLVLT